MAKTRAPLLSLEASGSIAKVLIMSRGRRQSYTKFSRKPKDPKTTLQLARREWFRILSSSWNQVSAYMKTTWSPLLKPNETNLKFAYLRGNLAYIDRGEWPSPEYPATRLALSASFGTKSFVGGPRHIVVSQTLVSYTFNWLLLWFRTQSPPIDRTPQTLTNAREANFSLGAGPYVWDDAPLDAGTYHYARVSISLDGKARDPGAFYPGTAT